MNAKLAGLARRRESLISQSAAQREQLRQSCRELKKSISFAKGVLGVVQSLTAHPAAVAGLTALLLSIRQGKLGKLPKHLGIGWGVIRLLQALRSEQRT